MANYTSGPMVAAVSGNDTQDTPKNESPRETYYDLDNEQRWFYSSTAQVYRDPINSEAREHQTLYLTAKGHWVLNLRPVYEHSPETYREITPKAAYEWLLHQGHYEAIPYSTLADLEG